ncbi:hypothetical protein PF008_g19052 [Phytophthora fragariae]|uniref:Uncharacterized protein n=1 Tax=Phytophthora fragariae TaxID=53985 RepID=A0A6G0R3T3_9STRA|nr:hypothetical protein PF008_g19052 [Phytophthora fragariae]
MMRSAKQEQDEDGDPREVASTVERRRLEYLRRHREQIQQRYRLEAERRVEELEADVAAMKARRDEVRAAKAAQKDKKPGGNAPASTLKPARSLPSIYARVDDLGHEELQLLASRLRVESSETQLNLRGKFHARYMKDAYPIAGSQLTLEKQREMEVAAKKKLLLSEASSLAERGSYGSRKKSGVFSFGLGRAHGRSKFEHYVGKLTTHLKGEQEQVRRSEAERQIRLCAVQHREGMEQFWRLMHTAPKREVIAWLKFHSFLDVNVPLVAPCALRSNWLLGATDSVKDAAALMLRSQHVQDITKDLIAQGCDVNAQNAFGETALQFCSRYGLHDCAKLLLANGADAFIRDRKGVSAVQYARDHSYESLYQLLLHYKTIEQVRAKEKERHETTTLLNQKRGALAATWSQTPEHFFTKLKVEQKRAGHLRNQYVDSRGHVIVCSDEE